MLDSAPPTAGGRESTGKSIGAAEVEKYDSVETLSSSSDGGWAAKGAALEGCSH